MEGDLAFINDVDVLLKMPYVVFFVLFPTSKTEKVWKKEQYYNSALHLDIAIFFNELPPSICLGRLQLCVVIGLV